MLLVGSGEGRGKYRGGKKHCKGDSRQGPSLEGSTLSGAIGHRHGICENSLISDSRSVPLRRGQSTGGAWGEVSRVPPAQD